MALAGRSAGPVCLLLLLAHLPSWDTQARPQREPDPDVHTSVVSKNNLKEIIKLLALKPSKDNHVERSTSQFLFSEESDPKVISAYQDSSQSIMRQSETPVKELENILNDLKKETEMQEPSSPSEEMQSSVMENILQDLEEHPVQKSLSASESRTPVLMENSFSTKEPQGPEKTDSSKDEDKMPIEPFPGESNIARVPNETPLNQPFKATPVTNLNTEVTNEDMNDAKRFEFFEKYEGIQDKKRAKAADLKDLLKHIIIACVAVTSLILAVIVLVHIYTSLFVKKRQQKPVTTNTNTGKKNEPDQTEVTSTEEKRSQQLEDNTVDIENQNTLGTAYQNTVNSRYQNAVDSRYQNAVDSRYQNAADTENQNTVNEYQNAADTENQNTVNEYQNAADTENQNTVDTENQDTVNEYQNPINTENQNTVNTEYQNTVDIENQNNNNFSSPPAIFLTDCEDVIKPFVIQPVETIFSPSSPSRKTDLLPLAESYGESPDYCLPSFNNMGENLRVQSRTFKMNHTSCNNREQHSKPKDHDYKRPQDKDTVPSRKKSNQRSSRYRPKSTEPKGVHTNGSSKQRCYRDSSWVCDSSEVSIALDTNENTNESRLSQHDGSACACYQHLRGGSSTDSYSD